MKSRNLLLVLVIITIVIFVAFVPYIDLENKELDSAIIEDETNENASNNNEKEQTPDEKNNEINNITTNRIVFIEEGTSSWCYNCADVASVLDELYNPDDPDFYYISMVEDKNDKANSRLYSDYNAFGFPTVYIDGGYSVIAGSKDFKSNFKQKLSEAKSRKASDISLNVSSEWNETRKELKNTVTVYNNEDEIYMGRLRVYISEMISPWPDWNGDPYKFAFVDYGLDKNIIIDANENKTFSEIWDSTGFSNVYKENLWVVAVVFNSESNIRYSNLEDEENKFNAYYVDGALGVRVTEGNLPPSIGVSSPKQWSHYIFGKEKHNNFFRETYIIGKTTVKVNVEAESGVEKVEYVVKGPFREIKETVTEAPYSWVWHKLSFGKYTITVKVYDKEGRTATDSIQVYAFML